MGKMRLKKVQQFAWGCPARQWRSWKTWAGRSALGCVPDPCAGRNASLMGSSVSGLETVFGFTSFGLDAPGIWFLPTSWIVQLEEQACCYLFYPQHGSRGRIGCSFSGHSLGDEGWFTRWPWECACRVILAWISHPCYLPLSVISFLQYLTDCDHGACTESIASHLLNFPFI